jgi:hypothetical protein
MFELKITTDAAVTLINERMRQEYKSRINRGLLNPDFELELLPYSILLDIAETATLDLIFLLPVDVLREKNNLNEIIVRTFHKLGEIYDCEEFMDYSNHKAKKLLKKPQSYFSFDPKSNFFKSN